MIKRYNQFVKGKINEDMVPPANVAPMPSEEDVELTQLENELPEVEDVGEEEEQEGSDIYSENLKELSDLLPGSTISNNSVIYKGKDTNVTKTIIFPSETFNYETGEGIFHVDKKKFKTAQEVANYLLSEKGVGASKALLDEVSDKQAIEDVEIQKESKSYRNTRIFQKYKK